MKLSILPVVFITITTVFAPTAEAQENTGDFRKLEILNVLSTPPVDKTHDGKYISVVEFRHNERFTATELLRFFNFQDKLAGEMNRLLDVPYYAEKFDLSLKQTLWEGVSEHGYAAMNVGKPKITDIGGTLKIVIPVVENEIYRHGTMTFSGNNLFTDEELRDALDYRKGEIVRGYVMSEGRRVNIQRMYKEKGYFYCSVTPKDNTNVKNGDEFIANFHFDVKEGPKYIYDGAVFNLDKFSDEYKKSRSVDVSELQSLMGMVKGQPLNNEVLNETVKKINALGKYELIPEVGEYGAHIKFIEIADKDQPEDQPRASVPVKVVFNLAPRTYQRYDCDSCYVRNIKFWGSDPVSAERVKEIMGLKENMRLDMNELAAKVKMLNQTKMLRPVIYRDVTMTPVKTIDDKGERKIIADIFVRLRDLVPMQKHDKPAPRL